MFRRIVREVHQLYRIVTPHAPAITDEVSPAVRTPVPILECGSYS